MPDAKLRKITVDYTIEFGRVLHGGRPDADFLVSERKRRGPDRTKPDRNSVLPSAPNAVALTGPFASASGTSGMSAAPNVNITLIG